MNPIGMDPWMVMEFKRQHEELVKKIEMERLVKEAFRNERPKTHRTSTVLALIGRELTSFGTILEERYSIQPENRAALQQESNPGGYS